MNSSRLKIAVGLAVATLMLVIINAIENVALITKVGPTPILSLASMATAAAALVVSWKKNDKFYLIACLLAVSGIIFMVPALNAMGYSFQTILFPGPILGVIFGLVILALGIAKAVKTGKIVRLAPN
jgi:hypothetical protein